MNNLYRKTIFMISLLIITNISVVLSNVKGRKGVVVWKEISSRVEKEPAGIENQDWHGFKANYEKGGCCERRYHDDVCSGAYGSC
jgi:hypothetical protein